ncbi:hypothetical protein NLD30_06160 [SCandidatus Aminicenantes bacterium Aminicenantia_JdfR_composite]|jgi:hypothetical protein|nr:hypothetical protein [SCandidatus Aminicenantes bacterium Aminicenantia_JdfR_composite]
MRKKIFILFIFTSIFFIFTISGLCKIEKIESQWASSPPKIDGIVNEWSDVTFGFDKKKEINFAFKNDSSYLYAILIFKNPKFLSSIDQTGITLWFNPEGKKKKNFGVKFKMERLTAEEFISLLERTKGPLPEEKKQEIKANPYYFVYKSELIQKKKKKSTFPMKSIEFGKPIFRFTRLKRERVYEFKIPFELIPNIEMSQNLIVGFEWGGMTKEMKAQIMKMRAEMSTRARERAASMKTFETRDSREEGIGMGSMPFRRTVKKYSFWINLKLAQEK